MNLLFDLPPITEKKPAYKRPAPIAQPIIDRVQSKTVLYDTEISELDMAIDGFVANISTKGFEWKPQIQEVPIQDFKIFCKVVFVDAETGEIKHVQTIEQITAKGHEAAELNLRESIKGNDQILAISCPIIGVFEGIELDTLCKRWVNLDGI